MMTPADPKCGCCAYREHRLAAASSTDITYTMVCVHNSARGMACELARSNEQACGRDARFWVLRYAPQGAGA